MRNKATGIVLMTYGSATEAEGVAAFMEHIYKGKAPEGLVAEFERRYRLIGKSPLIDITKKQAELLQEFLNHGAAGNYIVKAGMLHSPPTIYDAVRELTNAHANRCRGIILSPQYSSFIMEGYRTALTQAAERHGFSGDAVSIAGPWPTEPHFITLTATRVRESLEMLEKQYKEKIPVLFTTHSLPKRVALKDPDYLHELQKTIDAVIMELKDSGLEWYACYQSAGHTPEEWMKPDLMDTLSELQKKNMPAVLIAPIQFLADHLEIMYDLDIAVKDQCNKLRIAYHRIKLPNTNPLFIEALAAIARGKE